MSDPGVRQGGGRGGGQGASLGGGQGASLGGGQGPLLFQVNMRVLLASLSRRLGRAAGLDDVTDAVIAETVPAACDIVWLLGVWRVGAESRAISLGDPEIQAVRRRTLPDGSDDDIVGSCFSIAAFSVADEVGGDAALARLRVRLAGRGLRLMLDFVPNHTAPDHPWVSGEPDFYVGGSEADLARDPANWRKAGPDGRVVALGRDPYFPGWRDVLQLDYAQPRLAAAMREVLCSIAARCDAIRADMAMLILPDVFERVWGRRPEEFWTGAIEAARAVRPGLLMMAEVYWGLEDALRSRGFDLAYDKPFLDALMADDAGGVRALLARPLAEQAGAARFIENHDEPRAASVFEWPRRRLAVTLNLLSPGLRFLQLGQMEGARVRVSMHVGRAPDEVVDPTSLAFHRTLLGCLDEPALREGVFEAVAPMPAWDGNPSHERFVLGLWRTPETMVLVVANDGPDRGQCRARIGGVSGGWVLADRLGPERYERDGAAMGGEGLFLDLPGRGVNLFRMSPEG